MSQTELRIIQDPVGKGIEPTERVVEYHIPSVQIERLAARPNDLEVYGRRRGDFDFPCPICGNDLLDYMSPESAATCPNLICPVCNDRAETAEGELSKDWDETTDHIPVYVDGKQCWRRYRFGEAAMYDPYICYTLEAFHKHIFPVEQEKGDVRQDEDLND